MYGNACTCRLQPGAVSATSNSVFGRKRLMSRLAAGSPKLPFQNWFQSHPAYPSVQYMNVEAGSSVCVFVRLKRLFCLIGREPF
jgi:hypothetical protein